MTVSFKKVGPIRFIRLGSFTASWCIKTRTVTKKFSGARNVIVVTGRNLTVKTD